MKAMYTCPHCHKTVKDLNAHIARMHPEEVKEGKQENTPVLEGEVQEGETLTIEGATEENVNEEKTYHCVDCGGSVTYKAEHCPACGTALNWEGI